MNLNLPLRRLVPVLAGFAAFAHPCQARPIPTDPAQLFANLKPSHPRLIMSDSLIANIKAEAASNPSLVSALNDMRRKSDSLLTVPVSSYTLVAGSILSVSRTVLARMYLLGFMAHYDGNKNYAARAEQELQAAALFKDWNPDHFLDVAEMSHAFAIGYDWLYPYLTDAERASIRAAIKQKAFLTVANEYSNSTFWVDSPTNWNDVCNSGLALAALAIGKDDSASQVVLFNTLQSLQKSGALGAYGPDGAYGEGIGYWGYSGEYLSTLFSSMRSALGEDFDLPKSPGFSETGMFAIYSEGPTGLMVNSGDAKSDKIYPFFMTWLSQAFNQPVYAWFTQKHSGHHPLELLWYDKRGVDASPAKLPRSRYFRGPELAVFRSAWLDSNATFLAFKAGNPKNEHSHLDVGNVVLDALGKRWALDLGPDNYALPNYFIDYGDSNTRFSYYRVSAEGHNTLAINPGRAEDQEKWPATSVIRFDSTRQSAVGDISLAYPAAVRALRGVSLQNGVNALVQDEIQLKAPGDLWWQMHTEAAVAIAADGRSATLTLGTKRLWISLLSPTAAAAKFSTSKAAPLPGALSPAGQDANKNVSVVALHLTQTQQATLVVWMVPLAEGAAVPTKPPAVVPLSTPNWPAPAALSRIHGTVQAPLLRWEQGSLHVEVAGDGDAVAQLLNLNGAVLQELRGKAPGEFVFTPKTSGQGLYLLRCRTAGGDATRLLSRP